MLSTQGSSIIDENGNPVLLRGVNWFGAETDKFTPHGLWTRNYKEMIDQIVGLGYNMIRLPFSNQLFDAGSIPSGIDFSKNPDLQSLSGLQILDKVIDYAASKGLCILLDRHRPSAASQSELWYTDAYPESRWINDWKMLAQRYLDNPKVIGADLHNEPKESATWGGSAATDWKSAAERAGNAIHSVNPNWLIFVEGVQYYEGSNDWWGGNLKGVATNPVVLNQPNKVVYAPHTYGAGVSNQPWFSDPNYPANLPARFDEYWGYIAKEGIAPVFIGEWGGKEIGDPNSSEGKWAATLVDYIQENQLGFSYWSWNPNSVDTGGILMDDWVTVDQSKQAVVAPLLSQQPVLSPSPLPSSSPNPSPTSETPTPSTVPSPSPSPVPNIEPLPTPSPLPTSETPSPAPSPLPTSETPSPAPTATPSPIPTASPMSTPITQSKVTVNLKYIPKVVPTTPGTYQLLVMVDITGGVKFGFSKMF